MAMTLRKRKECVRPHGTSSPSVQTLYRQPEAQTNRKELTVSVVLEVKKLIAPLGHDPYGIFHERAYDEETSSRWYVSTASKSSSQQGFSSPTPWTCALARRRRLVADFVKRRLTVL